MGVNIDYQVHRIGSRYEATADLKWYGDRGFYTIKIFGMGRTRERALETAEGMAGLARVALQLATVSHETLPNQTKKAK